MNTNPPTVQEELENRDECHYRLHGVRVRYRDAEWLVLESMWSPLGDLLLTLIEPGAVQVTRLNDTPSARRGLKLGIFTMGDVLIEVPNWVPASECTLVSFWPVACCPPDKENPWNNQGQAKKASIPQPEPIPHRYEFV
jgi:hypothetical protein